MHSIEPPIGSSLLMNFNLSLHDKFDNGLVASWRALELQSKPYVFQTYDWNAYWFSRVAIGEGYIKPCIVVVSSNAKPIAIFPFGICSQFGFKKIEFLGGYLSDYNSPLYDRSVLATEVLAVLWRDVERILPKYDLLNLTRMPLLYAEKENPIISVLSAKYESTSYNANLVEGWEIFKNRLPVRFKKDNTRMRRRLAEAGVLEFKVVSEESQYSRVIDQLLELKERRYLETGVRNILRNSNVRRFYEESMKLNGVSVKTHLAGLFLNDTLIACHWGLLYDKRYYYLVPSYASGEWSKYSPGRLLLENLVEWSIGEGVNTFDFTVGGEAYKDIWCDSEMPLYQLRKAKTFRGLFLLVWLNLIDFVKKNPRVRGFVIDIIRRSRKI